LADIGSRDVLSLSVELPAASVELLELLKRAPGESGSFRDEFTAMTSAAGSFAGGVWGAAKGETAISRANATWRVGLVDCV
jgi:hypothetical protein